MKVRPVGGDTATPLTLRKRVQFGLSQRIVVTPS